MCWYSSESLTPLCKGHISSLQADSHLLEWMQLQVHQFLSRTSNFHFSWQPVWPLEQLIKSPWLYNTPQPALEDASRERRGFILTCDAWQEVPTWQHDRPGDGQQCAEGYSKGTGFEFLHTCDAHANSFRFTSFRKESLPTLPLHDIYQAYSIATEKVCLHWLQSVRGCLNNLHNWLRGPCTWWRRCRLIYLRHKSIRTSSWVRKASMRNPYLLNYSDLTIPRA